MRALSLIITELAMAAVACAPDRTISDLPIDQDKVEVVEMSAVPRRDLDLLFVIDSSGSMRDEQESLRANFPRVIQVLESIEGGLPNIQIGVITPSLGQSSLAGTGSMPRSDSCVGQGDDGVLRSLGAGGPRFLRSIATGPGMRETNFPGTLSEAFSQLADVGTSGCGIEQHLEALVRATDGRHPENAGFVRDDAYLGLVIIADEDDCSLARTELFGDGAADFRCARQAIECGTPATPLDAILGPRSDCRPRADSTDLASLDRYVEHFHTLKPDVRDIVVAGILGDPERVSVGTNPISAATDVGNSCLPPATGYAEAPVRIASFLDQFPDRTTRTSICDGNLSNGLLQIAELIKEVVLDPCFNTTPIDVDPLTAGDQYDCSVIEVRRRANQPDEELRALAACERGGLPCWRIVHDPVQCEFADSPAQLKLVIERGGEPVDRDVRIRASCVTAAAP